jgi:hypothetical protein
MRGSRGLVRVPRSKFAHYEIHFVEAARTLQLGCHV